jgi:hypothetical protein
VKAIVFLLVLANVLFYAFTEGYLGRAEHPDSGRVEQQVQADRMRIVSRGEVPATSVVPPPVEPPSTPAPEPESVKPPVLAEAPAAALGKPLPAQEKPAPEAVAVEKKAEAETNVCLLWEHLSVADAERIRGVLAGKTSQYKLLKQEGEGSGWWVYIPPLPGKQEADKKAAELRGFGVTDYFIIPDGPNRFAISLGIFSAEKGGQERLAELKEKGVRSARVTPRPGKDGTVSLEASGPLSGKDALLKAAGKPQAKVLEAGCK